MVWRAQSDPYSRESMVRPARRDRRAGGRGQVAAAQVGRRRALTRSRRQPPSTASTTSIRERCGFFGTSAECVPVLIRQRDHATGHGQPDRARLLTGLLDNLDNTT